MRPDGVKTIRWPTNDSQMRTHRHFAPAPDVRVCRLYGVSSDCAHERRRATLARAIASRKETVTLSSVVEPPSGRTLLAENADETWFFVPEWANSAGAPNATASCGPSAAGRWTSADSPLVVFNKRLGGGAVWGSAVTRTRSIRRTVIRYNDALIWFGANDGPPGMIIDWAGFQRSGGVDDPLIFSASARRTGSVHTQKTHRQVLRSRFVILVSCTRDTAAL